MSVGRETEHNARSAVVIGAGISGLATAFFLRRRGLAVTVLDRESHAGGTIRTMHDSGWLVEAGPNSALETTPLFREICQDLKITDRFVYANEAANKRYVLRGGILHALPMNPLAFVGSRLWSMKGKLRLLKEPFVGRGTGEESIAGFVERRLGREFLDYGINPFVAGVYAGNPEQLSVQAAFPKLYALEQKYGGLIMGMVRGRKERKQRVEKAKDRARLFSFTNGMQTLPDALAASLGGALRLNVEVQRIVRSDSGYAVEAREGGGRVSFSADTLVLSVPALAASSLLRPFDGGVASALESIYYPPVAEVFLGYRQEQFSRPLDGFGFLVPSKEKRRILGTIWSSTIFPNRAPSAHVALTTFVGGARQPDLAMEGDAQLVNVVSEELRDIMGVEGAPTFVSINRWDHAIPQYNIGHTNTLERFDRFEERYPGLYLCANYRGGISVGDCVMSAEKTAARICSLPTGS
jgi:oxygen-dependent protoporphyrinogen oxidase